MQSKYEDCADSVGTWFWAKRGVFVTCVCLCSWSQAVPDFGSKLIRCCTCFRLLLITKSLKAQGGTEHKHQPVETSLAALYQA